MSYVYSIDLGIHPAVTGGHEGRDEQDSYPLQIALTLGTLVQEQESDRSTGFTPQAPASFAQIKVGDIIIFRFFETTLICPSLGRSLVRVDSLAVTFRKYDGSKADEPWRRESDRATIDKSPAHERSLTFTSVPGGMELPCHFERDSSNGIVTYTVINPVTKNPVPYLFSVLVETTIMTSAGYRPAFYRDDPEMVISSDDRPGDGEENRPLDQFAGIAATSL